MAAGLAEMAARFAADEASAMAARSAADEAPGNVAVRAAGLRQRATALADDDARSYARVQAATDADERRRALAGATQVPLEVVEVARETALLAEPLTRGGRPALRGDAAVAVLLADAAARAATQLVRLNVAAGDLDGASVERAEGWCAEIATAVRSAEAVR